MKVLDECDNGLCISDFIENYIENDMKYICLTENAFRSLCMIDVSNVDLGILTWRGTSIVFSNDRN